MSGNQLVCRACGLATAPLGVQYCDRCFGPLDLVDPLPVGAPATPLVPAPGLGAALGLEDLWLKDETTNPTGSFKDRVVTAAAARAEQTGAEVLACSSTGNLARALAVHGGQTGLEVVVLVPDGSSDAERAALVDHGATVVTVRGDYDATNRLSAEASEAWGHWGWVNGNLRPWYAAGAATIGTELAFQAPGGPAQVVLPMASGALAYQVHRRVPSARLVVAQPSGCAPVAAAFAAGLDDVRPVRASTAVEVLAMGDPPDGPDVLAAARRTGGAVLAVAEEELEELVASVAGHGVRIDLASAVALAGARDAVAGAVLDPAAATVVVLTGGPPAWPAAPVAASGRAVTIDPSLAALGAALGEETLS